MSVFAFCKDSGSTVTWTPLLHALSNQILRLYEKINPADLNQFLVENKVHVCGLGANDEDIERFFVEKLSGGHAV